MSKRRLHRASQPPSPDVRTISRQRGQITLDANTEFTKTLSQWRENDRLVSIGRILDYRAMELDLTVAPEQHFAAPTGSVRPLRQHAERGGIHSCVNTSQINGLLWQGYLSQSQAEQLNDALIGPLRENFGEAYFSERMGASFRGGYPGLAKHFTKIDPSFEGRYFDARMVGDIGRVAISELLRGSVVVMDKFEHTVLAVGYDSLEPENLAATNLHVVDPVMPERTVRQQISTMRNTSMVVTHVNDPLMQMWPQLKPF